MVTPSANPLRGEHLPSLHRADPLPSRWSTRRPHHPWYSHLHLDALRERIWCSWRHCRRQFRCRIHHHPPPSSSLLAFWRRHPDRHLDLISWREHPDDRFSDPCAHAEPASGWQAYNPPPLPPEWGTDRAARAPSSTDRRCTCPALPPPALPRRLRRGPGCGRASIGRSAAGDCRGRTCRWRAVCWRPRDCCRRPSPTAGTGRTDRCSTWSHRRSRAVARHERKVQQRHLRPLSWHWLLLLLLLPVVVVGAAWNPSQPRPGRPPDYPTVGSWLQSDAATVVGIRYYR